MQKPNFKLTAAVALLIAMFVPNAVSAATWTWSGARSVTKIYPFSSGYYFFLDGAVLNANSCSTTGINHFVLYSSDSNYYGKLSGLIAAFTEGKTFNLVYDSDSTACWTEIDRFQIG